MTHSRYLSVNQGTSDDEEGLLSDWTIVVFTLTTTALVFFHMTQQRTVNIHRKAAASFASLLVIVALLYNILSMVAFIQRTQSIIVSLEDSDAKTRQSVRTSQIAYGVLTFVVSIVQLGLVVVIIQTSMPELGINIPGLTPPKSRRGRRT
jgi:hypothetical protein